MVEFRRKNSSTVGDGKDTNDVTNNKRRFSDWKSFRQPSPRESTVPSNQNMESSTVVVLTILSPDMVSLPPDMIKDEWEMFSAPQSSTPNITVHMHLLLVNLLNTYIRQQRVARQAIYLDMHMGTTVVRMLVSRSLAREIQTDCRERLGIGQTIVGSMMYASSSIEDYHIPPHSSTSHTDAQLLVARPEIVRRNRSASAVMTSSMMMRRMSRASSSRASSVQWGRSSSLVSWEGGESVDDEAAAIATPPFHRLSSSNDHVTQYNLERVRQSLLHQQQQSYSTVVEDQRSTTNNALETTPLISANNTDDVTEREYASTSQLQQSTSSNIDDHRHHTAVVQQIMEARQEWKHLYARTELEQIESHLLTTALTKRIFLPTICASLIEVAGIVLHSALLVALGLILLPVMEPVLGLPLGFWRMQANAALLCSSIGRLLWMTFLAIVVPAIDAVVVFQFDGSSIDYKEWLSEEFFANGDTFALISWVSFSFLVGLAAGSLNVLEHLETRGLVGVVVSSCLMIPAASAGLYGGLAMLLQLNWLDDSMDVSEEELWRKSAIMIVATLLDALGICLALSFVWRFWGILPGKDELLLSWDKHLFEKDDVTAKEASVQKINQGLQIAREMKFAKVQPTYSQSMEEFLLIPENPSIALNISQENPDLQLQNLTEVREDLFDESLTTRILQESPGSSEEPIDSESIKQQNASKRAVISKPWGWKSLLGVSCGILLAGDAVVCSKCEATLLTTATSDISERTATLPDNEEVSFKCPTLCADTNDGNADGTSTRIFYLILVHNEGTIQGALYLFRAIVDPRNTIVIHVDSKARHFLDRSHALWDEIQHCACGATVHVESVHSVQWGEWSMNLPTLWAMELAVNKYSGQWDTFVSLAGDSLPVYKPSVMARILQDLYPYNFVTSSSCETGLIPTNVYDFPSHWHKRKHYTENESASPWIWNDETTIEVHFGSQWVILQSDFVRWLVDSLADEASLPSFVAHQLQSSHKLMTDETFLPTVLMHASEWKHTLPKVHSDTGYLIPPSSLAIEGQETAARRGQQQQSASAHSIAAVRYERMDEHVPTAFGYLWRNQRYDVPHDESKEKGPDGPPQVDQPRVWGPYYLGVYDLAAIRKSGALFIRKVSDQVDENLLRLLPVERPEDIPFIDWPTREVTLTPKPNWQKLLNEVQLKRKQQQHFRAKDGANQENDEEEL